MIEYLKVIFCVKRPGSFSFHALRGSQLQGKKSKFLETQALEGICPAEELSGTFRPQLRLQEETGHSPNQKVTSKYKIGIVLNPYVWGWLVMQW